MHWIHKNTSENKNLNSPGLQAYLYFKTVKYNWHNGKHYMNSFLTFHRFQFKLTRVFLLEHNTWDWSICTKYVCFSSICIFLMMSHQIFESHFVQWATLPGQFACGVTSRPLRSHLLYSLTRCVTWTKRTVINRSAASAVCHPLPPLRAL